MRVQLTDDIYFSLSLLLYKNENDTKMFSFFISLRKSVRRSLHITSSRFFWILSCRDRVECVWVLPSSHVRSERMIYLGGEGEKGDEHWWAFFRSSSEKMIIWFLCHFLMYIGSGALSSFLTVRALRCERIEILKSYDLPQSLHLMVRRAENRIQKLMLKPRRNYQDGIESFMLGKRTVARCEMR